MTAASTGGVLYCIVAVERDASFLADVEVYLKSFLAARMENVVEVYLSFANGAWSASLLGDSQGLDLMKLLRNTLESPPSKPSPNLLSKFLSVILCRHYALHSAHPASVLIFEGSASVTIEHISFMNSVFEAQRQRIKIDVITTTAITAEGSTESDSVLLRQAASITGGYFLNHPPSDSDSLLPVLFSLSMGARMHQSVELLNLPVQSGADFRGACFCHGRVIDMGHVCSVCLSGKAAICLVFDVSNTLPVFCSFHPFCKVCKTKFNFTK